MTKWCEPWQGPIWVLQHHSMAALEIWCVHALVSNWWWRWWRRVRAGGATSVIPRSVFSAEPQDKVVSTINLSASKQLQETFILCWLWWPMQTRIKTAFPMSTTALSGNDLDPAPACIVFEVRQSKMKLILHIYITAVCSEVMHIFMVM